MTLPPHKSGAMPSNSSPPPDTPFTPRREFIHYTPPVILHLRRFFDQASLIVAYREDVSNNFCEFALDGRPWNSPKNTATERLLIEVLAILYQHSYTYLSTIDYGREPDDRLVMTFSKPDGRSDSPLPASEHSKSSYSDKPRPKRAPFALSFPSATMLRVVCPPLDSTPAILQAVRGSWPRGVVSEKKVGENTFEFKLKGYKWFQQDTFAVDSLRHILSLLSSLDTHTFSLLASISLTNRSRVKDLWLFTGPAPSEDVAFPDSPAPSLNASQTDFKRPVYSPDLPPYHPPNPSAVSSPHRRLATEPVPTSQAPSPLQHLRAATDEPARPPGSPMRHAAPAHSASKPSPSHTLRKPAPRAQLPVSVHDDGDVGGNGGSYRVQLPSTVPSGVENLTGVGAGHHGQTSDVFYSTSPFLLVDDVAPDHQSHTLTPKSGCSTPMTRWLPGLVWQPILSQKSPSRLPRRRMRLQEGKMDITLDQRTQPEEQIQEVVEHVASPTLTEPDMPRKSETGLIGMVSSTKGKGKGKDISCNGQGWVMVNVDTPPSAAAKSKDSSLKAADGEEITRQPSSPKASMSPAAKAIVIIDAVDQKHKKSKSEQVQSPSRIRRFFSLSRKDSKRPPSVNEGESSSSSKNKSRSNLDKLKNVGTSEASRNTARRSIDG
ncbi:hypothetical protein BDZ89DRAFT_1058977 [Hymenopellis radicata]|nr:hypothetical protein BDZ89DRAFT_1058977 [Hymenopellis radicata]